MKKYLIQTSKGLICIDEFIINKLVELWINGSIIL